jgi:hypothetical protein
MTRKNFIALAEILAHGAADETLCNMMADYLATTNPSFDRQRWFDYLNDVQNEIDYNI